MRVATFSGKNRDFGGYFLQKWVIFTRPPLPHYPKFLRNKNGGKRADNLMFSSSF